MREKCTSCKSHLIETARGRRGKGMLTELRCPKCRVLFYVNRPLRRRRAMGMKER